MVLESHLYEGSIEVKGEDFYGLYPFAFTLILNPEADPAQMEQAARAIATFLAREFGKEKEDYV